MTLTHWGEAPLVSVPDIDREHKELIDQANTFAGAVDGGASRAELQVRLTQLIEGFRRHCFAEERLMVVSAYPGIASHAEEHRKLVAQMTGLRDDLSAGVVSLCQALAQFVQLWTGQHIAGPDASFGAYLRARHVNSR